MRIHHCAYVDDEAVLSMVERLKESLQQLELSSCDVTDMGLQHLTQLQYVFYPLSLYIHHVPKITHYTIVHISPDIKVKLGYIIVCSKA